MFKAIQCPFKFKTLWLFLRVLEFHQPHRDPHVYISIQIAVQVRGNNIHQFCFKLHIICKTKEISERN